MKKISRILATFFDQLGRIFGEDSSQPAVVPVTVYRPTRSNIRLRK